MSIGTAFLDHLAKYGFAIGAVLFAVAVFALDGRSTLGVSVWVLAVLFVLGKPVLGAARGFRAGLRTDSTNQN